MMWTAGIQMKWVCDHRSESQFKQLRKSPEKKDFGASTGFESVASALALQCSTSLSYEDPYTGGRPIYWVHQPVKGVHIISFCVWFLSRVDQLNAEATGSNPVEAPKSFFSGYFRNCLNCDSLRWSHTHFKICFIHQLFSEICKNLLMNFVEIIREIF